MREQQLATGVRKVRQGGHVHNGERFLENDWLCCSIGSETISTVLGGPSVTNGTNTVDGFKFLFLDVFGKTNLGRKRCTPVMPIVNTRRAGKTRTSRTATNIEHEPTYPPRRIYIYLTYAYVWNERLRRGRSRHENSRTNRCRHDE